MGREAPIHKVMKLSDEGLAQCCGWDDELKFNTQVRHTTNGDFRKV